MALRDGRAPPLRRLQQRRPLAQLSERPLVEELRRAQVGAARRREGGEVRRPLERVLVGDTLDAPGPGRKG